ncbi:uncharacterized protein LOC106657144 [Trichogramma pretiosum]|uniref:uncharacterized protein LOC106657144 n=1 Tax=Trichogramma pretiosum TaxID=7493 RepID=UPI0006C9A3C7|nr:uncharacterized protein LOC106657144 [Trichogramma pretiosum]
MDNFMDNDMIDDIVDAMDNAMVSDMVDAMDGAMGNYMDNAMSNYMNNDFDDDVFVMDDFDNEDGLDNIMANGENDEQDEYVHVMEVEKFLVVDPEEDEDLSEIVLARLNKKINTFDKDLDGTILEIRDAVITGQGRIFSDDESVRNLVKVQATFFVLKPYARPDTDMEGSDESRCNSAQSVKSETHEMSEEANGLAIRA